MRKLLVGLALVVALAVGGASPVHAATGPQRFKIIFKGTTGPAFASGTVRATGHVENVIPEVLDPEAGTFFETDRLVFPNGTIDIFFEGTVQGFFPDPKTCIARPRGSGTFEIVGGTGAYEGATGGGTFTFPALLVFPHTAQGCGEAPRFTLATVDARGSISY